MRYMLDSNIIINMTTISNIYKNAQNHNRDLSYNDVINKVIEKRFGGNKEYTNYKQVAESIKLMQMMIDENMCFYISPTVYDECKLYNVEVLSDPHIKLLPKLSKKQEFLRDYISENYFIETNVMEQEIKKNAKNDSKILAEAYIYGCSVVSFDNHFVDKLSEQAGSIKNTLCKIGMDKVVEDYKNEIEKDSKYILVYHPKSLITKLYFDQTNEFNFETAMQNNVFA